jgi:hypothetical protein
MNKFKRIGLTALLLLGATVEINGMESNMEMEFMVLGDLHYSGPHNHAPGMMRAVRKDMDAKKFRPEVICQLGDIIENQSGPSPIPLAEGAVQWREALKDIKTVFPAIPFLPAPGNHDWYGGDSWFGGKSNLLRYFIPFVEKETGGTLNGLLFYAVRLKNCLFLFVNHMGMDGGMDIEQARWLQKTLAAADANPAVNHVFAFGHCGLWNVNYFRFNENAELLPLFAESRKLRVYFAGHVHRNNISVMNVPGGNPVLQAITAGLEANAENRPQEGRTLILNPPPSVRGYVRIPVSRPSYCVVTVKGGEIRLRYEEIGGGTLADLLLKEGKVTEASAVVPEVCFDFPSRATALKLHLYPFFPERFLQAAGGPEVIFNGKTCGAVPRNTVQWHTNAHTLSVTLPPELLQRSNEVIFTNPNGEYFLIRDCQLEAVDENGKSYFSKLYPKIISAGNHRNIYLNTGLVHPERGIMFSSLEHNAPDEMIQDFEPGGPLKIRLDFE